jgi:uncharacterized protein Yka (UPF0111/DUF47 family)
MNPESIPKPAKKYLEQEFGTLSDVVYDSTTSLKEICSVVNDPSKNSLIAKIIYDKENLADEIRERLNQSFSLEHHPPSILLDQVRLMVSLNKITNKIEHAARQIEFTGEYFPSEQIPALLELVDIVSASITKVCRSVKIIFDSFEKSADEVKYIEDLRGKSRTKLFEIQSEVLKKPETTFQTMFAVEKITLRVQQVSERAKQSADLIKNMALKYL